MKALPILLTLLAALNGWTQEAARPAASLSNKFFDRQAEFPNYFLPERYRTVPPGQVPDAVVEESKDRLARAAHSLFLRMTLPIAEGDRVVQRRYFQEVQKIADRIGARAMPGGGVVRSVLGYLYQEVYEGVVKEGKRPEAVLEAIANATEDVDSIDIRGIGSDMDILLDAPGGVSPIMVGHIREEILALTNSARTLRAIPTTETDELQNTLLPLGDVGLYDQKIGTVKPGEALVQGGSHLDFLSFDTGAGSFVEPGGHRDIVGRFIRGLYAYSAPMDASKVQNPAKQTFRGIRPLLEIPFLRIEDETHLRRELDGIEKALADGPLPNDAALLQFRKMMRNSRFSGAHNRLLRGGPGSLEERVREVAVAIREKREIFTHSSSLSNAEWIFHSLIAEYANSTPLENRLLSERAASLDEGMLIPISDFIQNHTDGGILYHGTPRLENGFSIIRGGMLLSGGRQQQGSSSEGTGVYSIKNESYAELYANGGPIFELRIRNNPHLRIVDMAKLANDPRWVRRLKGYGWIRNSVVQQQKAFERFVADYDIDILLSGTYNSTTIVLIQNTQAVEIPRSTLVLMESLSRCLLKAVARLALRLSCFTNYKIMYANVSPDTKKAFDEPIKIAQDMIDTITSKELEDDLTFERFFKTFPPSNPDYGPLHEKLRLKIATTIADPDEPIRSRIGVLKLQLKINILELYQPIATTANPATSGNFLKTLAAMQKPMEEAMADPRLAILDRLYIAKAYKHLKSTSEGEFLKLVGTLREGMEAMVVEPTIPIADRLQAARDYMSVASSGDSSRLADKLRRAMESAMANADLFLKNYIAPMNDYHEFASPEDFSRVADVLTERMATIMTNPDIPLDDRFFAVDFLRMLYVPTEKTAALVEGMRQEIEATIGDTSLPIDRRVIIIQQYKALASPDFFAGLGAIFRRQMEAAMVDAHEDIGSRLFAANHYQYFGSADDRSKLARKVLPTLEAAVAASEHDEGMLLLPLYEDLYVDGLVGLKRPSRLKDEFLARWNPDEAPAIQAMPGACKTAADGLISI